MNTREQFGTYLLLKKLGEDSLGECFRAGKIGAQGMEQVALLRVFNGPAIDGQQFWQAVSERGAVQKALRSPNLGTGIDLGQVRNVPYTAYDYVSGKNLAELLEQANSRRNPIPADHALLIAERIALGLAVGYETRSQDGRLLHGCLLPQLVVISNEGETKLLGFDVAPGLRLAIQGGAAADAAHFLSPEARAGSPLSKSDDVYSLGVLLLELLSGKPVAGLGNPAALVDELTTEPAGTPLPEELKNLLRHSLAPEAQRTVDAVTWHKTLSKLMFEGQFSPTTFNLAFYMHNLFRDEIEKETQEIEVEKTMEIPVPAIPRPTPPAGTLAIDPSDVPGAAPAPTLAGAPIDPAQDLRESTGVADDTGALRDKYGIEGDRERNKGRTMLIGIAAAVIVIGAGVTYMMTKGGAEKNEAEVAQPLAEPALPPMTPPPIDELPQDDLAAAEESSVEDLDSQVSELVDERAKELEGKYDQELEDLRAQLDSARTRAAEAEAAQAALAEAAKQPEPEPEPETPAEKAPTETDPSTVSGKPIVGEKEATEPEPTETEQVEVEPPTPQPEPKPAPPEPAPPAVRRGDLVTLGPGVTPPKKTKMRRINYPPVALKMRKEATVIVRVLVDETGEVADARLKGKKVGFGLDEEAISAARSAKFTPAKKNGVAVKIWWELPISFKL